MTAPAAAAAVGGAEGAAAGTAARSASSSSGSASKATGAAASRPKAAKPSTARSGGSKRSSGGATRKSSRPAIESRTGPAKTLGKILPGRTGTSRLVIAEFIVCLLVIALAPLDKEKHADISPTQQIKRLTALMLLFVILGLISAGGKGSAKVAGAVGGLVTLTLLFTERNVIVKLATMFGAKVEPVGTAPATEPEYEV